MAEKKERIVELNHPTSRLMSGPVSAPPCTLVIFGGAGGGAELTMAALHANFLEHGMVVVGFPKTLSGYAHGGIHWGPYARTGNHEGMPEGISDAQLAACRSYGAHVIGIAERLLA